MKMPLDCRITVLLFSGVLAGCAMMGAEYDRQRSEAASLLPAYEEAYRTSDCSNLRFKFTNGMAFSKDDALKSLQCLEIERMRNSLSVQATGYIQDPQLEAQYAYEDYRAIFTYLASGELALDRAREIYAYASEKSRYAAKAEMDRSNQLLAQGMENERRAWEQANQSRAQFFESLRMEPPRNPVVTTCSPFLDSIRCESKY
jgi:hypothetical protein